MIVLQSVRCRNFKALTEIEIQFPARCSYLIEGANESGKTSLLDAIYFAFAGTGPGGMPARRLVRRGEDEAAVFVEFAGDDAFGVLERSVPRHGAATVRLKLERRFQSHVLETEAEVQEELAKTFGLDAAGLARVSFLRELDMTGPAAATGTTARAAVERKEISRTRGDLADVTKLREDLARSQQRIELAEESARLDELNTRRRELDRRLRLVHIAGLRDQYTAGTAEVLSVQARLSGLNETRDELRRDLELAERQSATITVVEAVQTARGVQDEVDGRLQAKQAGLEAARRADDETVAAGARTEAIKRALAHLDAAEESGLERAELQRRKDDLEGSLAELERFRQQRATLTDARVSIEAELAGMRRNLAGDTPDTSLISARQLWTAWIGTFGLDADRLLEQRAGSRLSPGGLVSRAVSRFRGSADSTATDAESGPTVEQSEERAEIESAMRANNFEIPVDVDAALALIQSAGMDLSTPSAIRADEAISTEESLRVTDQNLVSVIVGANRLDESISQLESGLDGSEITELERGIEAALQRSAESLRAAAAAAGTGDEPPDRVTLDREQEDIRRSLPALSELASRRVEAERELGAIRAEREGCLGTIAELMTQLREIWPERIEEDAAPPPEYLEKMRRDCAAALSGQDAISLNRGITEIAAQISSGELALEVVERKQDQAIERLVEKVEAEGASLNRGDIEASLSFGLPQLRTVTSVEDQRIKLEIQQTDHRIEESERTVESREQRLGEPRTQVRLESERSRAEELERRIGIRLRASEIAGRAQEQMRAKAGPKTLQNARTLLPIVTGDRYFDLRMPRTGSVDLWDESAQGWAPLATLAFGTRRQVGLALRLAEAITVSGPSVPGGPAFMLVDEAALGSDPEHRARISAVLREGLLRETFAQVIVLAGADDFAAADFDRHLSLTAGSRAVPANGRLKAAAPGVIAELRRGMEE